MVLKLNKYFVFLLITFTFLTNNSVYSLHLTPCCNRTNPTAKCDNGLINPESCTDYDCLFLKFGRVHESNESEPNTRKLKLHNCEARLYSDGEVFKMRPILEVLKYRADVSDTASKSHFCLKRENHGFVEFEVRGDEKVKVTDCIYEEGESTLETIRRIVYIVLDSIAAFFAFLTMLSFLITYDRQNIHGFTQLTHVFAFFLLLLSWLGSEVIDTEGLEGTPTCKLMAISNHFIYTSAYAWLVVVNYDLMKAFWIKRHKDRLPKCCPIYLRYCYFGWGIPGFIVLVSVGIDAIFGEFMHFDGSHGPPIELLPNYGIDKYEPCSVDFIDWPYALAPNGTFFCLVILIILNTLRIVWMNPSWFLTQSRRHNQGKVLIWKILLAFGIFWFLDILSLVYISVYRDQVSWYLIAMDFFVVFQAIPVFVIYTCRVDTLHNLSEKFPCLRGILLRLGKTFCVDMNRADTSDSEMKHGKVRVTLRAHRGSVDLRV